MVKSKKFQINDISSKIVNRNPSGPFTTSTLQQVSSGRLGFGASRTMQIAQKLYQGIEIRWRNYWSYYLYAYRWHQPINRCYRYF